MPHPKPPQVDQALSEFRRVLTEIEGRDIDPITAPWQEIERGVIKLLGGAFDPENQDHGGVAFMVGTAFAERVCRELDGFWFPNRGAPGGAAIGFADTLVMLSPLDLAMEALSRARLPILDEIAQDLRQAVGGARAERTLGPRAGSAPAKIGPEDYRRLFDPSLVQFVCVDLEKAKVAWEGTPEQVVRDVEVALGRLPARVPAEVKQSMREQIAGAVRRLPAGKPIAESARAAAPLVELLVLLYGTVDATGFAPGELWQDVLLPLLHVGAAESFPPLDNEELEAHRQGADPLLLYVDAVPYQSPAVDEDGVLGAFPADALAVVAPCFDGVPGLKLVRVSPAAIEEPCAQFDPAATKAAVERFDAHLRAQAGASAQAGQPAGGEISSSLLTAAVTLLGDLTRLVRTVEEGKGVLCLRRATEAEAGSERAVDELRKVMQGPRIVLV